MLNSYKSAETGYTGTVAFLILAVVFIPAILIISRPLAWDSLSLGVICSLSCFGFAWRNWSAHSQPATFSPPASKLKSR